MQCLCKCLTETGLFPLVACAFVSSHVPFPGPLNSFISCQLEDGHYYSTRLLIRLSLSRKSLVRITDCPDMTTVVYRGR